MKIQGQKGPAICADGKFFVSISAPSETDVIYRQIELYMPGTNGTFGEEIVVTMEKWLERLAADELNYRWAIGSTGGQLTARYKIRESDGELVSLLALEGGMKVSS